MASAEDVRQIARSLPRTEEHLIRDRVKFKVGRLVYASLSQDEEYLGVGFPREEREAAVAAEPEKFFMPAAADLRYRWIRVRLAAVDETELRELLHEAWRMCVPKRLAAQQLGP